MVSLWISQASVTSILRRQSINSSDILANILGHSPPLGVIGLSLVEMTLNRYNGSLPIFDPEEM